MGNIFIVMRKNLFTLLRSRSSVLFFMLYFWSIFFFIRAFASHNCSNARSFFIFIFRRCFLILLLLIFLLHFEFDSRECITWHIKRVKFSSSAATGRNQHGKYYSKKTSYLFDTSPNDIQHFYYTVPCPIIRFFS